MTFALVDCNNFYVSCERVFRLDLEGVPVEIGDITRGNSGDTIPIK